MTVIVESTNGYDRDFPGATDWQFSEGTLIVFKGSAYVATYASGCWSSVRKVAESPDTDSPETELCGARKWNVHRNRGLICSKPQGHDGRHRDDGTTEWGDVEVEEKLQISLGLG